MPVRAEIGGLPRRAIDFREQPKPSDFSYHYVLPPGGFSDFIDASIMQPAFAEVQNRFGITVRPLEWGQMPPTDGRVPYVLVGAMNPLTMTGEQEEYLARLGRLPQSRINRVSAFSLAYGDSEEYRARAAIEIPAQDARLGINTIFPDATDALYTGLRTVSARDIADNIVCETVRLKYKAIRDASPQAAEALLRAQQAREGDIAEMQRIYQDYGLWHRSPTDGMLAFRTDGGYLTTQTKTDKSTMGIHDMSLVTGIIPEANEVTFIGAKIPSSDVEFLVALDDLPFGIAVHFHHNATTRGRVYAQRQSDDFIEYGTFASAKPILEQMRRIGRRSLLLREHGWVWFGSTTQGFERFVSQELGIPKNS